MSCLTLSSILPAIVDSSACAGAAIVWFSFYAALESPISYMADQEGSSSSSAWTGKNLEEMLQHLDMKDEELDDVIVGE